MYELHTTETPICGQLSRYYHEGHLSVIGWFMTVWEGLYFNRNCVTNYGAHKGRRVQTKDATGCIMGPESEDQDISPSAASLETPPPPTLTLGTKSV